MSESPTASRRSGTLIVIYAIGGLLALSVGFLISFLTRDEAPEVGTLAFDQQATCLVASELDGKTWNDGIPAQDPARWNHQSLANFHGVFAAHAPDAAWAQATQAFGPVPNTQMSLSEQVAPILQLCEKEGLL